MQPMCRTTWERTAEAMAQPSLVAVPRPSSSRSTRDLEVALLRLMRAPGGSGLGLVNARACRSVQCFRGNSSEAKRK